MTHTCVGEPDHDCFMQWLVDYAVPNITWTNDDLLWNVPFWAYFSDICVKIRIFLIIKIQVKPSDRCLLEHFYWQGLTFYFPVPMNVIDKKDMTKN